MNSLAAIIPRPGLRLAVPLLALLTLASCSWKPKPEIVTFEEWNRQLAGQKGHVVVVPVWATWCVNCLETLESTNEIAARYKERNVAVSSVCLNDATRKPEVEAARKIIEGQPEGTRHYLLRQDLGSALDGLRIRDLPAVLLVDAKGEIRYRLEVQGDSRQVSFADVEDAIESLL